jgi:hypothetical protein
MSYVSTVIIQMHDYYKEDEALEKLNEWLAQNDHLGGKFQYLDGCQSAGTKHPERRVVWGGINYLDTQEFIRFFKSLGLDDSLLTIATADQERYKIIASNTTLDTTWGSECPNCKHTFIQDIE